MDFYDTKSRIAEAFVESIFRRARYDVRPYTPPAPLRIGHEDFSPNFAVTRDGGPATELVAVKYRPSIDQFIALENQRRDASIFVLSRKLWPRLYFVLVTDHPRPDRSCFQAIALADARLPFDTVDLAGLPELDIFPHNVDDHERLLRRLVGLLTGLTRA